MVRRRTPQISNIAIKSLNSIFTPLNSNIHGKSDIEFSEFIAIFDFNGTNIEYTIWKNSHIRYYGLGVNRIFEFKGTNIEYENSHIRYSDPYIRIYEMSKPVISNMGCENTSQNDQKTSQNDTK